MSATEKISPLKLSNPSLPKAPSSFAPACLRRHSFTPMRDSAPSSSSNPIYGCPSPSRELTAHWPDPLPAIPNPFRKHSTKSTASPQSPQEKTTMTTASASDALALTAWGFLREHLEHAQRACITSSFQAEDVAVLHMVLQLQPRIPVIFLETGYHFPET